MYINHNMIDMNDDKTSSGTTKTSGGSFFIQQYEIICPFKEVCSDYGYGCCNSCLNNKGKRSYYIPIPTPNICGCDATPWGCGCDATPPPFCGMVITTSYSCTLEDLPYKTKRDQNKDNSHYSK